MGMAARLPTVFKSSSEQNLDSRSLRTRHSIGISLNLARSFLLTRSPKVSCKSSILNFISFSSLLLNVSCLLFYATSRARAKFKVCHVPVHYKHCQKFLQYACQQLYTGLRRLVTEVVHKFCAALRPPRSARLRCGGKGLFTPGGLAII